MSATTFRFAKVSGQGVDWKLGRHSALTPGQMAWASCGLCAVSLAAGLWFWRIGSRVGLGLSGLELLVAGGVLLAYARHAADRERIRLQGAQLVVELEQAGHLHRTELESAWVRVEPRGADGSLIRLSSRGRTVEVGRYLRPELRPALASEIRMALRGT